MKQRRINATLTITVLALTALLILTALPRASAAAPRLERQPLESLSALNTAETTEHSASISTFGAPSAASAVQSPGMTTRVSAALRSAPVMFIENVGQFDERARFQVRGGMGTMWLAEDAIWVTVFEQGSRGAEEQGSGGAEENAPLHLRPPAPQPKRGVNLRLSFPGANPHPRLEPFDRLDTVVSYFIGNDPAKWRTNVPVWGGVRYKDLYPGIDLEITSENGQMVQRVVVRDGADANAVRLRVEGADQMTLDSDHLRLSTAVGEYTLPLLQVTGAGSAKLSRPTIAGNQVTSPFTSDPLFPSTPAQSFDLLYTTFLGGSSRDESYGITVDASGATYVTGWTGSSDFPTTPGAFDTSFDGRGGDAFVVKLGMGAVPTPTPTSTNTPTPTSTNMPTPTPTNTPTATPTPTPTPPPARHVAFLSPPARAPQRATQVIRVPGDYPTIAEALAVALAGDTVQVAAGTYPEGGLWVPPGVGLVGAGWQSTIIDGNGADVMIYPGPDSLVEGFTIRGSGPDYFDTALWVNQGSITVRKNRITGNSAGLWAWCFEPDTCAIHITLEGNIVDGNSSNGINSNEYPIFEVRNNTVVGNGGAGIILNNAASLAENNIVVANASAGLVNYAGATVHHNDVWGNGQDYVGGEPGAGGLSMNPMFRDMAGGDYRLRAGSPAVGHGTPAGTDMGALPFTPVGSPPTGVSVSQTGDFEWTVSWDDSGAAGYNVYLGTLPGLYTRRFDAGTATTYALSGLPGDLTYYVAVSGYDGAGDESRVSTEVSFFVPPAPAGVYQEDSPAVVLTGTWTRLTDDRASGGGYAVSDTPGDTAQFTFSGDSVVLYRTLGTDGGRAEVSIDGSSYGTLEFYFIEQRWQVPAIFDHLGDGAHTLTLRVDDSAHPDSTGHKVYLDAFAVPSPYLPSVAQQQALERVNHHRLIAGIPPAQGIQAIHQGAQGHAEFVADNKDDPRMAGLGFHQEHPDLPGYIGRWPSDRAQYFGYPGGVGEDGHFIGDPIGSVDGWMETVYHRNLIMCYGCIDLGYGVVNDSRGRFDVLNMGRRASTAPPGRLIYTYPADGQTEVPHLWGGGEIPDPLPDKPKPVGYPASLYIAQPAGVTVQMKRSERFPWLAPQAVRSTQWEVTTAELRDSNGQLVPAYLLEQSTDPNRYLGPDNVFLIAHEPLALDSTYTAHIAGTDSQGVAFDHTWSFTTQPAAGISGVWIDVGACGAEVYWNTAGKASTWIEYGSTPAYGTQVPGEDTPDTYHYAILSDLTPETTYHYRIVSQDTQGNTRMTEDRTFSTRSSQTYRVPADYSVIQDALYSAGFCDTVQVAAGTYTENIVVPAGVRLIGSGSQVTTIQGSGQGTVLYAGHGSVVSGFTITGSGQGFWDAGIWIGDGASPTISNNRVMGNSMGIVNYCFNEPCTSAPIIRNNVVADNRYPGIIAHLGTPKIINNTIIGNETGISVDADGTVIKNNIVVDNSYVGVAGANRSITIGYNDVWNNGTNYRDIMPGPGALSVNPRFVDAGQGDYHLQPDSRCINAGDPDPAYNDRDGSRNDMGAYGGPYAGFPCVLAGDQDGDGDVDLADLQAVAARWRQAAGPPYDLDGDGQVTVADIMRVAAAWGNACP